MIILITVRERNARTGKVEEIVSHGENLSSGRRETLPCETPQSMGAHFCNDIGEWVLDHDRPAMRMGRAA